MVKEKLRLGSFQDSPGPGIENEGLVGSLKTPDRIVLVAFWNAQ